MDGRLVTNNRLERFLIAQQNYYRTERQEIQEGQKTEPLDVVYFPVD